MTEHMLLEHWNVPADRDFAHPRPPLWITPLPGEIESQTRLRTREGETDALERSSVPAFQHH